MDKKPIGKGLKALIPESNKNKTADDQAKQPDSEAVPQTIKPNPPVSGETAAGVKKSGEVAAMGPPSEPDPLFVENLWKERERRVKAIAAMNELIKKYNK